MAQSPYSEGIPSVEPQVGVPDRYQNIPSTPAEFGGLIGRGEEEAGAGALKAGRFYGQVAADQASNNWSDEVNSLLYGDPANGVVGVYQLKGQAAMDAAATVGVKISALRDKYRNQLLTPEQQLTFDSYTRRMQNYLTGEIGRHYDTQAQLWATGENKRSEDLALSFISSHAEDEEQFKHGASDLFASRFKQLHLTAGDKISNTDMEVTKLDAQRDATSTRIRALAPRNPELAKVLFDQADQAGLFKGTPQYDALANMIEAHGDRAAADRALQNALGPAGGAPPASGAVIPHAANPAVLQKTGLSQGQYDTFRQHLAGRESANYAEPPNQEGYMGRYQMGPGEIKDASARLNITPPTQAEFLANPQLQEALFEKYTEAHHEQLMSNPAYANASPERRAAILAGAHLGGVEGVTKYLSGKGDPGDRLGTHVSSYVNSMSRAMGIPPGGQMAQAGPPTMNDAGQQALANGKPDYAAALARLNADTTLSPRARNEAMSGLRQRYTFEHELEQGAETAADKARKDAQATMEGELFAKAVRKEPIDTQDLANKLATRQITPPAYNAIMAEVTRAAEPGQNDWGTITHLEQRMGAGEDVTDDILAAQTHGALKGEMTSQLLGKQNTIKKTERNQEERMWFDSLRTIAGMDATEHPMIDLEGEAKKAQVQLWGQARSEWTNRVLMGKENPRDVYNDMAPRYGHTSTSITALPSPRSGPIEKAEDIPLAKQKTSQLLDSGLISADQFQADQELIVRYQQYFDAQAKRDAEKKARPTTGGGARAVGVRPAGE